MWIWIKFKSKPVMMTKKQMRKFWTFWIRFDWIPPIKGVHVPSMIFDSTGTKKIVAIASYVIEIME